MSRLAYLVEVVDRYGEAIEWDLHERHRLDLLDFFRGRHSWRKLLMILGRLPSDSAYREAMLNDPEMAEQIAAMAPPDGPPARPEWSTYSPLRAGLDNIFDRLGEVVAATYAAQGGKPPKYPSAPRPVTEVDRARLRREKATHDDLVAEVKAAQERWAQRQEEAR